MAQNPSQHDAIFWSTLVQAGGSVVIVFATIALVWVTALLVKATNRLARVGEDTWKSNVSPVVWTMVANGEISTSTAAIVNLTNACAIAVEGCYISIYFCTYIRKEDGDLAIHTASNMSHESFGPERLEANGRGTEHNFWEAARAAVAYATQERYADAPQDLVGGIAFFVGYTHTITGRAYSYITRYSVEDIHRGSLRITNQGSTEPEVIL